MIYIREKSCSHDQWPSSLHCQVTMREGGATDAISVSTRLTEPIVFFETNIIAFSTRLDLDLLTFSISQISIINQRSVDQGYG